MYYTSCSPFHNRRGSCGWRRGTGPWCSLENKQDNLIFCVSCGTKFSQVLIFPIFRSSLCDLPKTKLPPKLNPLAKLYTRKSHAKSRLHCIFLKRVFLSEIKRMKLETKLQENKRWNFSRLNTGAIIYQVVRSYCWSVAGAISHTRARCDGNQIDTDYRLIGPVSFTPETLQNGVFPQKMRQMFFVHSTPKKFEIATISGYFGFVFEENSRRKIILL